MDSQYDSVNVGDIDVVRSTQFVDDFPRGVFRVGNVQPPRFDQGQMIGLPYSTPYQQTQSANPWQNGQPVFGTLGGRGQSMYPPCFGPPIASSNAYNKQLSYPSQPRENHFDTTSSNRMFQPFHNVPQGAPFSSQPGYMLGNEYYPSQQLHGVGQEIAQPRPGIVYMPAGDVDGQAGPSSGPPLPQGRCEGPSGINSDRDTSGVRGGSSMEKGADTARATPSTMGSRATHTTPSPPSSLEDGTLRAHLDSLKEQTPVIHTNNTSILLSSNSSKSSPPYTLSQRKQLRVEEKSYLKEVKRSIAEGRVPQVRLQQNNNGEVVKYKAQFLNALKLAALALVPNADIDIKNSSTMQEIMKEVKRQFIIEKPLPEGMVGGFLQRLYKRNRAVYHRHWAVHGDQSKPDDCPSAAWLQLVDYWKSKEGSKECERNKANASAKKGAAKLKSDSQERQKAGRSEEDVQCTTYVHKKTAGSKKQVHENATSGSSLPRCTQASYSSKIASSNAHSDRPPMLDISNKLHALVDEFVSHLSSECDSLANNVSATAQIYLAPFSSPPAGKTQKQSNRTAAEVLSGLKRPSEIHKMDSVHREGKSHMEHAKANLKEANSKSRDGGRSSQPVELLSSDPSSDEGARAATKYPKKQFGNHRAPKARKTSSRGNSPGIYVDSPLRSPESSHVMNYSYEGDTKSGGGKSVDVEPSFPKLSWPKDIEDSDGDEGTGKKSENNLQHFSKESHKKEKRSKSDDDFSMEEGDESDEEDPGRKPAGTESDVEELPVLPKVPVKRKLLNEPRSSEKRTPRGKAKSTSPQIKKNRTPQIDASVITQLEFGRRPQNSNPIRVRVKVWVLHPQFEGKVVAEAYAGINHKSRCINDEQDLCKKGQQMISVIRVFYKSTPVMFKKDGRYPKHIAFLDQAEGLPNSPILWGVCYLTPIPSMEEITRMMGNVTSAVCGRASSTGTVGGVKGGTNKSLHKKGEPHEDGKEGDTVLLRNRGENSKVLGKKNS